MSKLQIHSSTVEETFMFGSPPLFSGFSLNTCSQEAGYKPTVDCKTFDTQNYDYSCSELKLNKDMSNNSGSVKVFNKYPNGHSYPNFPRNGYYGKEQAFDSFSGLSLNGKHTNHVDSGIRILEQAGIKVQQINNELVFKKRKDLRALKNVLSPERYREVVMKFGDGGDDSEILKTVHKTMKSLNRSHVTCLFCQHESQVFENFPVVDGTLFLTPVRLSQDCIYYMEDKKSEPKYMGYICVSCMEGKNISCKDCSKTWFGSFFQIGTLYSYNILSAIPCCDKKMSCKNCTKTIIDLNSTEASNLFFSYFSKKTTCPHCLNDDFHYVKTLSSLLGKTNIS